MAERRKLSNVVRRQKEKRLMLQEQLRQVVADACMRSRQDQARFTAGGIDDYYATPDGIPGWRLDKGGDYIYSWEEMGTGDLEFFLKRTYMPAPPLRSPLEILAAQV